MKTCKKCNVNKPFSEFSKNNKRKDKHNTYCKVCNNQMNKLYYYKNIEARKQKVKYYKRNNPEKEKAYQTRYHTEINPEYHKLYFKSHKETIRSQQRKYNLANKTKIAEYQKVYQKQYRLKKKQQALTNQMSL